jgi:uncharacterized protein (TIGR00730 family)
VQLNSICIFSGSSLGNRPDYAQQAEELARTLARRGTRIVYGGAQVGLMGVVADTALAEGGEVVGVIPHHLDKHEVSHTGLTRLHIVGSMHERKALMAELSDGFIALPGGLGTLEEFAEVVTWSQLALHVKPTGLLNAAGYYDALLAFFDHAVDEEFFRPRYRSLILANPSPAGLLTALETWEPPDFLASRSIDEGGLGLEA